MADADPNRAIVVVDADGDHRPLEPGIGHPRHCEQQFAGEEGRLIHPPNMDSRRGSSNPAAASLGQA